MRSITKAFTKFANATAKWAGKPLVFCCCLLLIVLWAAAGPVFGFSDTWQLAINTSTTIITFLMVFLIQNTQNRDNAALHAKLDELIRVGDSKNEFIGIEHLSDEELDAILKDVEDSAHELHAERRQRAQQEQKAPTRKTGARVRAKN